MSAESIQPQSTQIGPTGLPDYSTCSIAGKPEGSVKYGVKWRGKFDPIAVCDDPRDAEKIKDALNGHPATSWDWIPVDERLPDDDQVVLIATKSENLRLAIYLAGHWYEYKGQVGTRLSASSITHWTDPVLPTDK